MASDSESGLDVPPRRKQREEYPMVEMTPMHRNNCWSIFQKFDNDGDGLISLQEFRKKLDSPMFNGLSKPILRELRRRADRDKDGQISFEEFFTLVNDPSLTREERANLRGFLNGYYSYATRMVKPKHLRVEEQYDGQYIEEFTCKPPPVFIILISLVEIIVFIIYAIRMGGVTATGPVPMDSPLIYNPYKRYEAWRYLTYMLIHVGYYHIISNLIVQLLLGIPLEMVHKFWRVGVVYISGVIAGSLGTSLADPYVFLAGASGGVYAIITSHLATITMNYGEMDYPIPQLAFFVMYIGLDVGVSVYNRYWAPAGSGPKVGYAAHLAGGLAGLLIGIGVLRNLEVKKWEKYVWWVSVTTFVVLVLGAIVVNIFYTDHFPPSKY